MKSIKKWWTHNFFPNQHIILVNTPTIFLGGGWLKIFHHHHAILTASTASVRHRSGIGPRWRFFRTFCCAGGYRWLTTFTSSRTFGRIGMVPGATKNDRWMDEMDGWMDGFLHHHCCHMVVESFFFCVVFWTTSCLCKKPLCHSSKMIKTHFS